MLVCDIGSAELIQEKILMNEKRFFFFLTGFLVPFWVSKVQYLDMNGDCLLYGYNLTV
jgi:hypothetical protein